MANQKRHDVVVRAVTELEVFTIYSHPPDAPDHFVVRRWVIQPGEDNSTADPSASLAITLSEARAMVPPGLFCIPRTADDDPVIVESWI